ncbi:MAG: thioredoxin [Nitrospirae bacterium]|nr:MAG: thioredoxin [Nitrospirota bacterium]
MGEYTLDVTSSTWDKEVLNHKGLVLVDFWAAWCGPCKIIGPVIEELAKEYDEKVKVVKVNTDENPDLASRYKIMGIPTLMFIKDGNIVDTMVGAVPKNQIKSKLDSLLK